MLQYSYFNYCSIDKFANHENSAKLVTLNISSPTELVSIVDLRADYDVINSVSKQKHSIISKTSESQTDNPDGVDFDWDLSDKTDNETQVCLFV